MKDADINVVGLSNNTTTRKTNWKIVSAIIGIIVLAIGVIAGIILVRQNQNISEKASCVAACPNTDGNLVNCANTADTDGEVSTCSQAGRVEVCGQNVSSSRQYCCPSAGGNWTTNLTLCSVAATATATATSTSTATATATSTSTTKATATSTSTAIATATSTSTTKATATSKSTATSTSTTKATSTSKSTSTPNSTATAVPIPVTGGSWPTILGAGFGAIMILVSLGLAL